MDFAYIRQGDNSWCVKLFTPDRYTWGSHLMNYAKGAGFNTTVYQGGYLSSYNGC